MITEPGTYTLTSIHDMNCPGSVSGSIEAELKLLPTGVISGELTICEGDQEFIPISLTGNPDWTINYTINDIVQSPMAATESSFFLPVTQEGLYELSVISDNFCSNEGDGFASVEFYPPINIDYSEDQGVCVGEISNIWAQASGGIGEPYSYSWVGDDIDIISETSISLLSDVTTSVSVTATDLCEYSTEVNIPVIIHQLPPIAIGGNQNICGTGFETIFNNTPPSYLGENCLWLINGDSIENCGNVNYFFSELGVYDVELLITSPQGCFNQVLFENYMEVYSQPQASFSFNPEDPTVAKPTVDFYNESTDDATLYEWWIGDIAYFQEENPSFDLPTENGPDGWMVCLEVTSDDGCKDDVCLPLILEPDLLSHVANSFTPDGDGLNEFFDPFIEGMDPDHYELLIYDRSGRKVFETRDVYEKWNGSFFNNLDYFAMNGIYNWQIIVRLEGSTDERKLQGWVNLMR